MSKIYFVKEPEKPEYFTEIFPTVNEEVPIKLEFNL